MSRRGETKHQTPVARALLSVPLPSASLAFTLRESALARDDVLMVDLIGMKTSSSFT
jgi:hypothetical protein